MTQVTWFVLVGGALVVLGLARLATAGDWIVRLLALNITSGGTLVVLVSLAGRGQPDPVPHALALTGIVITVAVTGVGLVLTRLVSGVRASTGEHDDRTSDSEWIDQHAEAGPDAEAGRGTAP